MLEVNWKLIGTLAAISVIGGWIGQVLGMLHDVAPGLVSVVTWGVVAVAIVLIARRAYADERASEAARDGQDHP